MHPLPTRTYKFGITDSTRWARFPARADDIFVITPAKSGTTWMQTIVTFLVFGRTDLSFVPAERSPWFDCKLAPIEETVASLEQDDDRHIIKTHTPLDGVPFSDTAQYLGVYRDPRDAFLSWLNHETNMVINTSENDQSADERFFEFVEQAYQAGDPDNCLGATAHHLDCLWRLKHLPNIHLFHYADMQRNLPLEIRRVADAIGVEVSADSVQQFAKAASFKNMRGHHEQFVPGAKKGFWHDAQSFLNKGESGQWRGKFTDYTLQRFDSRLRELVGDEMANWLIEGSNPS